MTLGGGENRGSDWCIAALSGDDAARASCDGRSDARAVPTLTFPVYITGVGASLPERTLTNEQIAAGMPWLDLSADWVREHTGIRRRHVAAPDQHAIDLGYAAARQALARSACDADDIDLIIMATNTAEFVYPAGAAMIQERLAAECAKFSRMARAAALDLQQGCASFVAGIAIAASMIQSGACARTLVIGADVATRMVDWTDRSAVLLGDGGTACVLGRDPPSVSAAHPGLEVLASFMRTIPDRESIYQRGVLDPRNDPFQHMEFAKRLNGPVTRRSLYARFNPPGGTDEVSRFFQMDGRKVYRFVRRTVAASGYLEVMCRAGLVTDAERERIEQHLRADAPALAELSEEFLARLAGRIDRFIPHGANMVLDQELADQMQIPYERMALTLAEHGNTSAASVGITLERLLRNSVAFSTIAKRDAQGVISKPARDVVVRPLARGHTALLLSFGAGTSWNYVVARVV